MPLWQKDGGTPQPLPYTDRDADGLPWDNLANNEEGRAATGWAEAPAYPDYNPAFQHPQWSNDAWVLVDNPEPEEVVRRKSRIEFLQSFPAAKRIAVRTTSKTNPIIEDFLDLLQATDQVELDNSDTIAGLNYLVSQNLLTSDDVSAIRG